MLIYYCLKFRKNTESKDTNLVKTRKMKKSLSSKCTACDRKKSGFVKQQEASGILSSLGMKTRLIKIPNAFKTAWIYV